MTQPPVSRNTYWNPGRFVFQPTEHDLRLKNQNFAKAASAGRKPTKPSRQERAAKQSPVPVWALSVMVFIVCGGGECSLRTRLDIEEETNLFTLQYSSSLRGTYSCEWTIFSCRTLAYYFRRLCFVFLSVSQCTIRYPYHYAFLHPASEPSQSPCIQYNMSPLRLHLVFFQLQVSRSHFQDFMTENKNQYANTQYTTRLFHTTHPSPFLPKERYSRHPPSRHLRVREHQRQRLRPPICGAMVATLVAHCPPKRSRCASFRSHLVPSRSLRDAMYGLH